MLYFVLRILCTAGAGMRDYVGVGLALGFALLSLVSVYVLLVPVGAALVAKLCAQRGQIRWPGAALRILVLAAIVFGVCGWYYLYVWVNLGTPIVANTGSGAGSPWPWWQDPGFRTGGDYLRFGESLRAPLYSVWYSVWDGLYSTLWGDSYYGGQISLVTRPPWSYEYMVAGMWLALVPTAAIFLGSGVAIWRFLRRPTILWMFLLATAFLVALMVIYGSLVVPYYFVKAFYGLAASVPFCALAALGFDLLSGGTAGSGGEVQLTETARPTLERSPAPPTNGNGPLSPRRWLSGVIFIVLGVWAFNVAASYWISASSVTTQRYVIRQLLKEGHHAAAAGKAEQLLAEHPNDDLTRILMAQLYLAGKLNSHARQMLEPPPTEYDLCMRHILLGLVSINEGRRKDALEELQTAMKRAPDDPYVAQEYAQAVAAGPDVRAAIDAWRNVLRIDPFEEKCHVALAQLYAKAGDAQSARRHQQFLDASARLFQQAQKTPRPY
jgi:hypothetical protein